MDLERVYSRLPVALQNLAVSLEGRRVQRRRFNADFDRLLGEYQQRERWPWEKIAAFRDERLAAFVRHAATTVPYYRDLFARLRIDPGDIRTLADLAALPILSKGEVQDQTERFWSEAVPRGDVDVVHTSGSTGAGLRFPTTRAAQREQWAVWYRYYQALGLSHGTWCLYFGGRSVVPATQRKPPFWRVNRPGRQIMFSAYHLSAATADAYLAEMQRTKAPWIHGYPSFVALIAGHARERRVQIPVRWVTLGAENVLPQQEALIEEAFGVRPTQHYGMAEAAANISQCPRGKLHVDEDFAAVEFDPRDGGASAVVGTNLSNRAFPLLRYEVGDHVTLGAGSGAPACDCGRPGRIVATIDGRQEDYIVTRSGARLGRLDHVFKDLVNIREAQLVQTMPGEMTVRIVRGPRFTDDDERLLREELAKRIGGDVGYQIEYCDAVERTARGKLRFVVSRTGQLAQPAAGG